MFFKLGLIIGAALTITLITVALVVGSKDQPSEPTTGQPSQQEPLDPASQPTTNNATQPVGSAKDAQENVVVGQDPSLLIVWSEQKEDRLTISLQVDATNITDCQFRLLIGNGSNESTALAKVMATPNQRGCIGHIEEVGELTDPVQLVIEASGTGPSISCRFDFHGELESDNGLNLFWSSSTPSCIGNFNP